MDIGRLIDLVLDGPRTAEENQAIGDWLDARREQREAIRAELLANPALIPYELLDGTERQFRPGYSPAPTVPVKRVGIGGARVGQVQQDDAGRWVGYYFADAPGEHSVARGQQEPRETVEEAVADVLTEYVLRQLPLFMTADERNLWSGIKARLDAAIDAGTCTGVDDASEATIGHIVEGHEQRMRDLYPELREAEDAWSRLNQRDAQGHGPTPANPLGTMRYPTGDDTRAAADAWYALRRRLIAVKLAQLDDQ